MGKERSDIGNVYRDYPGMIPLRELMAGRKERREGKKALMPRPIYMRKLSPAKAP